MSYDPAWQTDRQRCKHSGNDGPEEHAPQVDPNRRRNRHFQENDESRRQDGVNERAEQSGDYHRPKNSERSLPDRYPGRNEKRALRLPSRALSCASRGR
jgi:hypothetical protein